MKAGLLVVLVFLAIALIMAIPAITIDVDSVVTSDAFSYVRAAMYFVPVVKLIPLLVLVLAFWIWRVVVAIFRTLLDVGSIINLLGGGE